ncbi:hypothetical protein MSAN_01535200 [Mycena sanguinolenta]|uniref:Uncharacterized protein n=1 Tax=Mycena sanguinolenta TaxID=230812 RepID=A0A8H6Y6R1_9AGAR|nr:hypothetical protein MSAN_01535200 [Mycena sanguinolenta]
MRFSDLPSPLSLLRRRQPSHCGLACVPPLRSSSQLPLEDELLGRGAPALLAVLPLPRVEIPSAVFPLNATVSVRLESSRIEWQTPGHGCGKPPCDSRGDACGRDVRDPESAYECAGSRSATTRTCRTKRGRYAVFSLRGHPVRILLVDAAMTDSARIGARLRSMKGSGAYCESVGRRPES